MSSTSYRDRWPENVPGRYYVDQQCLDCACCWDIALSHFSRNNSFGYYYVSRQPSTPHEVKLLEEGVAACPCGAIFSDGERLNWVTKIDRHDTKTERRTKLEHKECEHCSSDTHRKKRWWRFW